MEVSANRVEAIVRRVLQELRNENASQRSATVSHFAERVFSVDSLESLSPHVQEIVFAPETIVTPAAKDELRDRGILTRCGERQTNIAAVKPNPVGELVLFAHGQNAAARSIESVAKSMGWKCRHHQVNGNAEIVAQLDNSFSHDNSRALALVENPWELALLANRYESIRAAQVRSREEVVSAVRAINANFLVVALAGRSSWELQHLATAYLNCIRNS